MEVLAAGMILGLVVYVVLDTPINFALHALGRPLGPYGRTRWGAPVFLALIAAFGLPVVMLVLE